jgi:RHS repeat-associated protein
MMMPGRNWNISSAYRYGFNGKENDNEVKGEGNLIDYGMRVYDPRIAKFLSVDPLTKSFPWYTPYQFAGNSPILNLDLDGLEEINYATYFARKIKGETALQKSEWLAVDRTCACETFAKAAEHNTKTLNDKVYEPINQIHNYYQWADRRVKEAGVDIRWFKAAEEVTAPFFGIGASQHGPGRLGGGFSKDASRFLAAGNSFLFKKNIGMMKNILETGSYKGETGCKIHSK